MLAYFLNLPLVSQLLLGYFLFVNVITLIYFWIDKIKSQTNDKRISERTLWILALIGGSLGALFGMNFFRHKTKKLSFQAGLAMILVLQILILFWIINRW